MSINPNDKQNYFEEFFASIEQGQRLVQGKGQVARPIMMKAEGVNAYLMLLNDRVRIQKREEKTFLNQDFKPNRDIPLSQISGIRIRKATTLGNGYIQFLLNGASENSITDVRKDENVVLFRGAHEADFEKIKMAIEMRIANAGMMSSGINSIPLPPRQAAPPPPPPPRAPSYIDELEQLAALRDKGVITEEEFTAKKKKILGI